MSSSYTYSINILLLDEEAVELSIMMHEERRWNFNIEECIFRYDPDSIIIDYTGDRDILNG